MNIMDYGISVIDLSVLSRETLLVVRYNSQVDCEDCEVWEGRKTEYGIVLVPV
jgi:hypothetical protein